MDSKIALAAATPEDVAAIPKSTLWMLVNHMEFAVHRGTFTTLPVKKQLEVLKNLLLAQTLLAGWSPPEGQLSK